MNKQGTFAQSIGQYYRQYVEFINDLIITNPMTQLLFLIPNLGMVFNIMVRLDQNNQVIRHISLLGINQIFDAVISISQNLALIVTIFLIIVQSVPIFIILNILISSYVNRKQVFDIGYLKSSFERSIIQRITRILVFTNQYIMLPLVTTISIMQISKQNRGLTELDPILKILYIVLIAISPITYIFGEYHALEIHWQNPRQNNSLLMRVNFPHNIIDVCLILAYIITINLTDPQACFITAISIYCARIAVALYFPCYQKSLNHENIYFLISSTVFTVGVYLAYLSKNTFVIMSFVVFLMLVIWKIKERIKQKKGEYVEISNKNTQLNVQQLKKHLWRDGLFTFAYRELIILQRKNSGYRQDLIISILKQKCYMQQLQARGGAKIVNSQDLVKFQNQFIVFISKFLILADRSVSILKLLQKKEPKPQIFVQQVASLVEMINQNKKSITKMFLINQFSAEAHQLLLLVYSILYKDIEFLKKVGDSLRDAINSTLQKRAKLKLFNKRSSVIFINILEDVGKITKASKNLPAVLGYSPHNLIGLSINQIIPYSIKPFHEEHLINFVNDYSKRARKRDPKIQFYAYDKNFHLRNVVVTYYFIMNYFSSFQLSGAFKRIDNQEEEVIITDFYGNLQGWTQKIGERFCLDDIPASQCRHYNIIPLMPAMAKYMNQQKAGFQTIFFKPTRVNHPHLILMDYNKIPDSDSDIHQLQTERFQKLLEAEEIMEGYCADIQIQTVVFCHGNVRMKKIVIKNLRRIENLTEIEESIKAKFNNQNSVTQQIQSRVGTNSADLSANDIQTSFLQQEPEGKILSNQYTIQNSFQQGPRQKTFDTNFSLDNANSNFVSFHSLKFEKTGTKTMNLTDGQIQNDKEQQLDEEQRNEDIFEDLNRNSKGTNNSSPVLQQTSNFTAHLVVLAFIFLGLVIFDQISLIQTQDFTLNQCIKVINRNRQMMIFSKSVFNPNMTYIDAFLNGKMIQQADWLGQQTFAFKTYYGSIINQTNFYLFNVQIPSTLQRVARSTDPIYKNQIHNNFNQIIYAYDNRIKKQQQLWSQQIGHLRNISLLRQFFIVAGFIIFSIFLITMYMQYRKHKKNIQAFFKFQKVDLQSRIQKIHQAVQISQRRAQQWHLKKQFYQIVKNQEITNCPFKQYKNIYDQKIKFETNQQKERKIGQSKFYLVLGFILCFVAAQIAFVASYQYLYLSKISFYQKIPLKLDEACKLFVLPNLRIAGLFQKVPPQIFTSYSQNVRLVLQRPIQNIPDLFTLLQQVPCQNCTILYPLLATNFRSYFSNFEQIIVQKQSLGDKNVDQLWQSVDIVVDKILKSLVIKNLGILWPIVVVYVVLLLFFFAMIMAGIKAKKEEKLKLQIFLKFFSEENLTKNKHMNSLLNKNI